MTGLPSGPGTRAGRSCSGELLCASHPWALPKGAAAVLPCSCSTWKLVCLSACPSVCLSAGASSCGSSVTSGRSGRPRTGCCSEGFEIQLNFGVSVARLFVSSLYFVLEKVQLLFLAARSIRSPCCEITRAALLACGLATRVELSVHAEQGWSGSTAHQTC